MSIPADQCLIAEIGIAAFAGRVPEGVRDKVELRFRREGSSFILFSWRPKMFKPEEKMFKPEEWFASPIAKFTYVASTQTWRLFWMGSSLRWRKYEGLAESKEIGILFQEVDQDTLCCFWG